MPVNGTFGSNVQTIRGWQVDDSRVNFAAQTVNPALAQGTVAMANAYPWLSPQTAYTATAAGAQPGDPLAQAVATGVINHKGGGFWGSLGHIVTAPMRAAVHLTTSALGEASDIAQPILRGTLTAAETPFQVGAGVLRDVASAGGDIVGGIASGVATGAAVGLAGGPLAPISVAAGAIGGGVIGGVLGGLAQAKGVEVKGGIVNPLAQSTGGLAIGALATGNKVDLGSGFLPGGAIHEQQMKNAQAAASINGHALTPGRMLASGLVRPGTTPYNLLSGVTDAVTSWNLDPTRYVGEEFAAGRAARKIIPGAADVEAGPLTQAFRNLTERSGQLATADPNVHSELAREFLTTDGAAQRFIARSTATDSADEIWRASGKKIPPAIAHELAAHTTEQGTLEALLAHVENGDLKEAAAVRSGRDIASTFTATRPGARLNSVMERLGGTLPAHTVDLLDLTKPGSTKLDTLVNQADNFMTQARFTPDVRSGILNRLMASGSPEDASRVLDDMTNGHLRDNLTNLGHDPAVIDRALKGAKADTKLLGHTAVNELATNTMARSIHTGEELLPIAKPEQVSEYTRYTYNLPDPSEVRRLTTPQNTKFGESLSTLYNSDAWKSSTHAADYLMQSVFKKAVTVRPALAVRTMAMQHAKMAANGLQTRFSDMGNLFRMVTNPEFRTAFEVGAVEGAAPLAKAENYLKSLRRMSGGYTAEDTAAHQIIVGPGHDLFPEAWGSKIAELHADPVARSVAGQGFEGTANDFWDGPLAKERQQLAVDLNRPELATSREAADAYVRDEIGSHLSALTADNPHLMEAIATGHIPDPNAPFEAASVAPLEGSPIDETVGTSLRRMGGEYTSSPFERLPRLDREGSLQSLEYTASLADEEGVRRGLPKLQEFGATLERHTEHQAALQKILKDMGTPDVVTLYRSDPGGLAEGAKYLNASTSRKVAEDYAREFAGGKVVEVQVPRDQILGIGDNREKELIFKVEGSSLAPPPAAPKGIPLLADHADGLVNPDAIDHLAGMALDNTIKVPIEVPGAKDTKLIDPDFGHKVGRMTNWFYSTLIGKPMDFFYNSPALNQLYWKEITSQAHLLDSEGLSALSTRMADLSGKVNIPDEARKALEARVAAGATGKVTLEHLDTLAQARSVDALQNMTIDMAKKTGWQEASRLMIPFGKHWQQELTQWARLAADHPEAYRKAQMTVEGAVGSGFFHKDQYGKYVFNYPGSDLISKVITGTPTPMSASASGLSILTTSLLPGFGPIASVAASKILPNKPEYDEVRAFFSPFGDPTQKGALSVIEPPWAKTLQTALSDPEHDRDAGNTTMQVARYLVSTGKFTTDTPEAQATLLKEAGSRAKKLLILQALGKFVLPSSPSLEAVARAKGTFAPDGRTVTAKLLSDDLQKMRTDDYEHSSENFLAKYGDSAMLFLQAATRPNIPGAASTKEQSNYLRSNPDIAEALPNSAAFFAPQGGQTFDPASIARQIHMGERDVLTPKQQVALANDQVGSMMYYQLKGGLGPKLSSAQLNALSVIKGQIAEAYPGFNTIIPGLSSRVTDSPQNIQKVLIPELQKSLTLGKTKDSQTGQALSQYLQLRDAVDGVAQKRGLKPGSFAQSTSATDLRSVLRQAALSLSQDNQGFSMLFDRILDRELRTDTQPASAVA